MNHSPGTRGFTLIEIMIVVAIVAILTAIALPNYQRHVTETRRGAAQGCLLELAQFAERYYTTRMTYLGLGLNPNPPNPPHSQPLPTTQCRTDLAAFYTFSVNGTADARSYSLQAVAQGSQATRDPNCTTLRINQTGDRTSLPAAAGCW